MSSSTDGEPTPLERLEQMAELYAKVNAVFQTMVDTFGTSISAKDLARASVVHRMDAFVVLETLFVLRSDGVWRPAVVQEVYPHKVVVAIDSVGGHKAIPERAITTHLRVAQFG
jgi:hypothetical protein